MLRRGRKNGSYRSGGRQPAIRHPNAAGGVGARPGLRHRRIPHSGVQKHRLGLCLHAGRPARRDELRRFGALRHGTVSRRRLQVPALLRTGGAGQLHVAGPHGRRAFRRALRNTYPREFSCGLHAQRTARCGSVLHRIARRPETNRERHAPPRRFARGRTLHPGGEGRGDRRLYRKTGRRHLRPRKTGRGEALVHRGQQPAGPFGREGRGAFRRVAHHCRSCGRDNDGYGRLDGCRSRQIRFRERTARRHHLRFGAPERHIPDPQPRQYSRHRILDAAHLRQGIDAHHSPDGQNSGRAQQSDIGPDLRTGRQCLYHGCRFRRRGRYGLGRIELRGRRDRQTKTDSP